MPPVRLALLCGLLGAIAVALSLAVLSALGVVEPSTFDVNVVYRPVGEAIQRGEVPYRDFEIEYPPGALVAFAVPAFAADGEAGYRAGFLLLMLACGAVVLGSVAWLGAHLGLGTRAALGRVALAAAMLVALGAVSLSRFDLLPVAVVMLALVFVVGGAQRAGAVALGAATAAKLFPVVLLPLFAAWTWHRRGRESALAVVLLSLGVAVITLVPFLLVAPGPALDGVTRQLERPLELESLGASVVLLGDWLGLGTVAIVGSFGSTNVEGWGVRVAEALSGLAGAVLLVLTWVRFARGRADGPALLTASAASIAVLLAFAKVLSPQFLVWLVPLVVLVPGRRGDVARSLAAAACVLTAVWFPELFRQVTYEDASAPLAVVMVRNLLLLAVALTLLPATARGRGSLRSQSPSPSPGRT